MIRAKKIRENIDFTRGGEDLKGKLGLGKIYAKDLKPGYYIFGNKGSMWTDRAHIAKSGISTTLCGTPMLSYNSCKGMDPGCEECIKIYRSEI